MQAEENPTFIGAIIRSKKNEREKLFTVTNFVLRQNHISSRSQRSPGTVVDAASKDVPIIARDGEPVVHLAVTALLVLEQHRRVVERRELDEAVVQVPDVAPPDVRRRRGELRQAGAGAADHDVRGRLERAGVVVRRVGHAPALVHRARPLVAVHVAVHGEVHPVLLPELLQRLAPHGLLEGALRLVVGAGGVTQDAVREEDEPWLLLPVHGGQALLDELVLLGAWPPVLFRVGDAEPEHAVVRLVPEEFEG
jgi:hypothetical protein